MTPRAHSSRYRRPRRSAAAVALAAVALLGGPPADCQEGPPLFVDRVDVTVVNVEVFVTDGEGRPVLGLTRDDFELLEDGEPVEITNFYAVASPDRLLRGLDRGRLPAEVAAAEPLPRHRQLNLVVLVDHFNLSPANRKRALEALEGFLEDRLIQGDNVMLVGAFRSPAVVTPLTRDREAVAAGLRQLGKAATYRQTDLSLRRQKLRMMNDAALENDFETALQHVRSYVQATRSDLRQTALALRTVVRSLAGLPGRKALVYVSEGLPRRPGEEMYQHLLDLFGSDISQQAGQLGLVLDPRVEALSEDEGHLFNEIVREANANNATFYTVDASGPRADTFSAEEFGLSAAPGGRTVLDGLRRQNLQEPLIDLAEATGGRSVLDTFNFAGTMERVADDFDAFYSLGYASPAGGDGKFHKLTVRVHQTGLEVRHRSGFIDKPLLAKAEDRTVASALYAIESNPLGVMVDFGRQERRRRKRGTLLPVLVRVPIGDVALVPTTDGAQGRLQFLVTVRDEEGGLSAVHREPYPITVPTEMLSEARQRELGWTVQLRVRPGLATVSVGVVDEVSGVESYVRKQVRVEGRG